jgi:hypothetical protein
MTDHRHGLPHFGDVITGEWTGLQEGHSHIIKRDTSTGGDAYWLEPYTFYGRPGGSHNHDVQLDSMTTTLMLPEVAA